MTAWEDMPKKLDIKAIELETTKMKKNLARKCKDIYCPKCGGDLEKILICFDCAEKVEPLKADEEN